MDERSPATRDEVDVAIGSLTTSELCRLRRFACYRVRSLGRAASGRSCEDLLQEAMSSTLAGAGNGRSGRCWNKSVTFERHLLGAMRSISSHWKEHFRQGEPYLESELPDSCPVENLSRLDLLESNGPEPDRSLLVQDEVSRVLQKLKSDQTALRVILGWQREMDKSEILRAFGLTGKEFEAAVKRIRCRADQVKREGFRGDKAQ